MSPLYRDEDGCPVYGRVAIGDTGPEMTCSCGRCFTGPVTGVMVAGGGYPDVALVDCPCGSTRGFQMVPEARAA